MHEAIAPSVLNEEKHVDANIELHKKSKQHKDRMEAIKWAKGKG